MTGILLGAMIGLIVGAFVATVRRSQSIEAWNLAAAVAATALALTFAVGGWWLYAGTVGLLAAFRWWWWRNGPRRRKRKSPRQLGHKARARLAAMLRSMPKPGPVLRPAPQGARA